jgi:hypothetical protein
MCPKEPEMKFKMETSYDSAATSIHTQAIAETKSEETPAESVEDEAKIDKPGDTWVIVSSRFCSRQKEVPPGANGIDLLYLPQLVW